MKLFAGLLTVLTAVADASVEIASNGASAQRFARFYQQRSHSHDKAMNAIMSNMTIDHALKTLHNGGAASPELLATMQELMETSKKASKRSFRKQSGKQASLATKDDPAGGYSGVDKARAMLNDMLQETQKSYADEIDSCCDFEETQSALITDCSHQILYHNAVAAEAREEILRAQSTIEMCEKQIPELETQLEEHLTECKETLESLRSTLSIVLSDIEVMTSVLAMTSCDDATAQMMLLSCVDECTGKPYVSLNHSSVIDAVSKLKSAATREMFDQELALVNKDAKSQTGPLWETTPALSNGICRGGKGNHITLNYNGNPSEAACQMMCEEDPDCSHYCTGQVEADKCFTFSSCPRVVGEVKGQMGGENYSSYDCHPKPPPMETESRMLTRSSPCKTPVPSDKRTGKCTMTNAANCYKLQERFQLIQGGIMDERDRLIKEIADKEKSCLEVKNNLDSQIKDMKKQLEGAQSDLAAATSKQQIAEEQSRLKSEEYKKLTLEMEEMTTQCHEKYEKYETEECGLRKIRGELAKMGGEKHPFFQDCEVTDWIPAECSVPCGGGSMTLTRKIATQPYLGTTCPLLEEVKPCNMEKCPIDCVTAEWSGWGTCSAECGGGVRERLKSVITHPQHEGAPCGETSDVQPCNAQACDKACILSDWTAWGMCSKACNGGSKERTKIVLEQAVGQGECAAATSESRFQSEPCNAHVCAKALSAPTLACDANVIDVILLLDGSGSLAEEGWAAVRMAGAAITRSLKGKNAQVAAMAFSGPMDWPMMDACVWGDGSYSPNTETDCKVRWLHHFTEEKELVATTIEGTAWPQGGTLTNLALSSAQTELMAANPMANTIVIVITDGRASSEQKTIDAAKKLRDAGARLMWVPVTEFAPLDFAKAVVSLPVEDNIVQVNSFGQLEDPSTIDSVVANLCPAELDMVGCFVDDGQRNMPSGFTSVSSKEQCMEICRARQASVYSIQYETECFCGITFGGDRYPQTSSEDCAHGKGGWSGGNCDKMGTEFCGGPWRNAVFAIEDSCATGYYEQVGDRPGWTALNGHGGGESVEACSECGTICSADSACNSYECSDSELRCNLNGERDPSSLAYKDYSFCSKKTLFCSSGSEQVGVINSDVGGCGLTGCDARYGVTSIDACEAECKSNSQCKSFTWAPLGGDRNHADKNVCTLYSQEKPNTMWGPNQIFCKVKAE